MSTTQHEFDSAELARLSKVHQDMVRFQAFVMQRFAAFALQAHGLNIEHKMIRTGGNVSYEIDTDTLYGDGQTFTVRENDPHYQYSRTFFVAKDWLFMDADEEAGHVQFLVTKRALFDPAG